MEAKLMLIHALSALQPVTGQGSGIVDLPIAREKATDLPYLPGSTIKGVVRAACKDPKERTDVFGPEPGADAAELFTGSVVFSDARLLLLPVRSLMGIFAWVTSPLLLLRLARDLGNVKDLSLPGQPPSPPNDGTCLVSRTNCCLTIAQGDSNLVVLEERPLTGTASPETTQWGNTLGNWLFPENNHWKAVMQERLCIVSDNVMGFLVETCTQVTARIQMDNDTKNVQKGKLWYEEALPAETVLTSLVVAAPVKAASTTKVFDLVESLINEPLQFGGNATVGSGLCQVRLV